MNKKWIIGLSIGTVAVLGLGIAAWAGPAAKGREGRSGGNEGRRGKLLYGQISTASGSSWTIKPELPPKLKERLEARAAEKGIELPALPESITVDVGESSRFWLDGSSAAATDFKAGDEVVIRLDKNWKETGASIIGAADPETARQYVLAKMDKMRGEGGGRGGQHGKGGHGGGRPHPAFGVITAISADSITIKPEIPDFIKAQMEERQKMREEGQQEGGGGGKGKGKGDKPRRELPGELTFKISDNTIYVVNEDEQNSNPFKVGDRVGILPARPAGGHGGRGGQGRGGHEGNGDAEGPGMDGPPPGGPDGPGMDGPPPGGPNGDGPRELQAGVITDYASAEARMKEMQKMAKEHREGRKGKHGGEGGPGDGGED